MESSDLVQITQGVRDRVRDNTLTPRFPKSVFYTEDRSAIPNSLHLPLLGHHLMSTFGLGTFDGAFPFGKGEKKGREDSRG